MGSLMHHHPRLLLNVLHGLLLLLMHVMLLLLWRVLHIVNLLLLRVMVHHLLLLRVVLVHHLLLVMTVLLMLLLLILLRLLMLLLVLHGLRGGMWLGLLRWRWGWRRLGRHSIHLKLSRKSSLKFHKTQMKIYRYKLLIYSRIF